MSNVGESKVSDRKIVKSLIDTYGKRAVLAQIAEVLYESCRKQRGRSTLEERPFHFARRACLELVQTGLTEDERGAEATAFKSSDAKTVEKLVGHYGPTKGDDGRPAMEKDGGILAVLRGLFINNAKAQRTLDTGTKNVTEAIEKLVERRALYKGSDTAEELGFTRDRVKVA